MSTQKKNYTAVAGSVRTVDGVEWTLRYAMRAMDAIQEHFNEQSLSAAVARMREVGRLGAKDLVGIVYAGLKSKHPQCTMDDAWTICDTLPLGVLQEWITEAFLAAQDEQEPKEGKEGGGPQ